MKNLSIIILFFISFVIVIAVYLVNLNNKNNSLNSTKLDIDFLLTNPIPTKKIQKSTINKKYIEGILKNNEVAGIDYSVVLIDLKSNDSFLLNENKIYASASLYKLWLMAYIFEKINSGDVSYNLVLSKPVSYLNTKFSIPPEYTLRSEGQVEYSIKDAIYKMITESDNESALLLTDYFGTREVENYMKNNGYSNTSFGLDGNLPNTNALEVSKFFKDLYLGKIVNKNYSDDMLQILKDQTFNHKAAKYIPSTIDFAHKTGELQNFSHDAGIIFLQTNPYVIVIMTSTNQDFSLANEFIAKVSKDIFTYFNSRE